MHKETLLDIILDQIQQDLKDGDTYALFDMLEEVSHDSLMVYLSPSRHEDALAEDLINE